MLIPMLLDQAGHEGRNIFRTIAQRREIDP